MSTTRQRTKNKTTNTTVYMNAIQATMITACCKEKLPSAIKKEMGEKIIKRE